MRNELRIGSRSSWVAACLLVLAGPAAFLLWPGDLARLLALLFFLPLVLLVMWEAERKNSKGDYFSGGDSGGSHVSPSDSGSGE